MATSCPSYVGVSSPRFVIVNASELKLEADYEAGETFEDIEYAATDEDTFRAMMACFSPVSPAQMEQWVALYRTYASNIPANIFYFSGPFSGEGEFRLFDVEDTSPPTTAHPRRFQLLWQDCRGECVGNGVAALMAHNEGSTAPPSVLVFGTWADSVPKWEAVDPAYEPLIKPVRSALLQANLEFGWEDMSVQLSAISVED